VEFDQLRHFLSVVQWESFSKAAEEIGLSQSALSRSVSRLEEQLGRQLLERQPRKVVPSEAGRILETRARELLARIDDIQTELSDDGVHGTIRVGAIPTIAPYFLPTRLRDFQSRFPEAKVVVQEETTAQVIRKVHDGDVDVAIAALPIESKYLEVEELFEEELKLLVSSQDALAKKETVRWSDLEQRTFILMGEAHCLTTNVLSFCHQKNLFPLSIERTSQLAMLQELVSLQHGISLIPEMAVILDSNQQRVYRSLSGTRPTRTVVMVTNPYRYESKLLKSFLGAMRKRPESEQKVANRRKK
jgi:LysR family hydrogen peroxide-inducible transcriptional activator